MEGKALTVVSNEEEDFNFAAIDDYAKCDAAAKIGKALIENVEPFGFLTGVPIVYLLDNNPKGIKHRGKEVAGDIRLVPRIYQFLTGYQILVRISNVYWKAVKYPDRERLITHELLHLRQNEKGEIKLVAHDIEEFFFIQENYGNGKTLLGDE